MPTDDEGVVYELEIEVEAELDLVRSSGGEEISAGPAEWVYDPTDVERDRIGLRSILDAAHALDTDGRFLQPGVAEGDALGG